MSKHFTKWIFLLALFALLMSRWGTRPNSAYYKAHADLRKLVQDVQTKVGGCAIESRDHGGSDSPAVWLDCASNATFWVSGSAQDVRAFMQALKAACVQADPAAKIQVTLERERAIDDVLVNFVLKFTTPATRGRVTVELTPGSTTPAGARSYVMHAKIEESGW